jgi:transmembrane 9 superfamily protein 2/4
MNHAALVVLLAVVSGAAAWYIPGVSPLSYIQGQEVVIRVNSMTSSQAIMPFPHYSVKTCMPPKERLDKERKNENLGEVLWGDQIEPSVYKAEVGVNATCRLLCGALNYEPAEMAVLMQRIEQGYRGNMVLDNLPVGQELRQNPLYPSVMIGYPLGVPKKLSTDKKTTLIHNHLAFTIGYSVPGPEQQNLPEESYRIVSFYVTPYSVAHKDGSCVDGTPFNPEEFPPLSTDSPRVQWSYSVNWRIEEIAWGVRWDVYLRGADVDAKIHWFSIINSSLIVLFLSGMVAMILLRALHRDFNRYNDVDNADEAQEETGWKLVHGDVFRIPSHPVFLAMNIGTGSQLIGMIIITLFFALLGFLSPSNRGGLLTAVILLFVLLGSYNGYMTARLCKTFKVQSWVHIFKAAVYFPGILFSIYISLNFVQWGKQASSAVPFSTLIILMLLWVCVSMTLVFMGAVIGFKRDPFTVPCSVNPMPRLIPEQRWYLRSWFTIPCAGVLPFGAAFIELVFILSSMWQGRVYYVFGFLALVFVIVVITCAEITIVMVYFQLCYEDYNWWWRSFLMSASSGVHLFLYSAYYFATALSIQQMSSTILYFGYMLMCSIFFGIAAGTIGFLSAFFFVRYIYGHIRID